jgi:hypothetical protein
MDHQVGAELQRALQRRRAEAVVDRQQGAAAHGRSPPAPAMSKTSVSGFEGVSMKTSLVAAHRGAKAVDRFRRRSWWRCRTSAGCRRTAAGWRRRCPCGGHDVLARLHGAIASRQDRRHAGRGGDAGLAAFERRQALLHRGDGGVGEARVDVARFLARETAAACGGAVEDEARGEVQRLGVLVELAALGAGAHRQGVGVKLGRKGQRFIVVPRLAAFVLSGASSNLGVGGEVQVELACRPRRGPGRSGLPAAWLRCAGSRRC